MLHLQHDLRGETNMNNLTQTLESWAGRNRKILAFAFTDIVDSTAIGLKLGDQKWIKELAQHFNHGRDLVSKYNGFVVKVIGDAFFVAFHNSTEAVDFALEFSKDTGVDFIGIRIGIHSGQVQIMDNDIYGLNINQTARIQSSVEKEGISVSDSIKEDYLKAYGSDSSLKFIQSRSNLKNFPDDKVWRVKDRDLINSYIKVSKNRRKLLGFPLQKEVAPKTSSDNSFQPTVKPRVLAQNPILWNAFLKIDETKK